MFSGGVSFDGDPAKADAALDEAVHCANIVRAAKAQLGLPAMTRQFDLRGGGVVWVYDGEYTRHIYIDVRQDLTSESAKALTTRSGFDIYPVALFTSHGATVGVRPSAPIPPTFDATRVGSVWANPPYRPSSPPYQLSFEHGAVRGDRFPGTVDWSDRRPRATARFYGLVLSWWSIRNNRYQSTSIHDIDPVSGMPEYGLRGVGDPNVDTSMVYLNGVEFYKTQTTVHSAAFHYDEASGKTYLLVTTAITGEPEAVYKYEVTAAVPTVGTPARTGSPVDVVYLSNPPLPPPPAGQYTISETFFFYSEVYKSHINSSGTHLICPVFWSFEPTYTPPVGPVRYDEMKAVGVMEYPLDSGQGQFLFYKYPEDSYLRPDSTVARSAFTQSGVPGYTPYSDYFPFLAQTISSFGDTSAIASVQTTIEDVDLDDVTLVSIVAADYKVDTPVYLYGTARSTRFVQRTQTGSGSAVIARSSSGGYTVQESPPNSGSFYYQGHAISATDSVDDSMSSTETSDANASITLEVHHSTLGLVDQYVQTYSVAYNGSTSFISNVSHGPYTTTTAFSSAGLATGLGASTSVPTLPGSGGLNFFATAIRTTEQSYTVSSSYNDWYVNDVYISPRACDLRVDYFRVEFRVLSANSSNSFNLLHTGTAIYNQTTQYLNEQWSDVRSGQDVYTELLTSYVYDSANASWSERLVGRYSKTTPVSPGSTGSFSETYNLPSGRLGLYLPVVAPNGNVGPYVFIRYPGPGGAQPPINTTEYKSDNTEVRTEFTFHSLSQAEPTFSGGLPAFATSSFDGRLLFAFDTRMTAVSASYGEGENYHLDERNPYSFIPYADVVDAESKLIVLSSGEEVADLTSTPYLPTGLPPTLAGCTRMLLLGPVVDDENGQYASAPDGLSSI